MGCKGAVLAASFAQPENSLEFCPCVAQNFVVSKFAQASWILGHLEIVSNCNPGIGRIKKAEATMPAPFSPAVDGLKDVDVRDVLVGSPVSATLPPGAPSQQEGASGNNGSGMKGGVSSTAAATEPAGAQGQKAFEGWEEGAGLSQVPPPKQMQDTGAHEDQRSMAACTAVSGICAASSCQMLFFCLSPSQPGTDQLGSLDII
eukprot:scaffold30554_cov15-Tisochrysis_lutea.AAC.1